jgi:hypothetical protein
MKNPPTAPGLRIPIVLAVTKNHRNPHQPDGPSNRRGHPYFPVNPKPQFAATRCLKIYCRRKNYTSQDPENLRTASSTGLIVSPYSPTVNKE